MKFIISNCSGLPLEELNLKIQKLNDKYYINLQSIDDLVDLIKYSYLLAPDFGGICFFKENDDIEIVIKDYYLE